VICSARSSLFNWFTILEQILEYLIRPVQHALKECIVSIIKQLDDSWCVLVTISVSLTPSIGGRPRVALDLPQYRNQTTQEHNITVATARSHGKRRSMMFLEFRGCAVYAHQIQKTGTG